MSKGDCAGYPETPCRVNLDLMPESTPIWMYGLTAIASIILLYGVWQMIQVWRLGRSWQPGDLKLGLKRLVVALGTHRKFRQEAKPGRSHAWLFAGFVVLFIGTTLAFIDMDIFETLGGKLLVGKGYLAYELALDFFGLMFVLGVATIGWRRYRTKPESLHKTTLPEAPWLKRLDADLSALLFLFLIGITGFLMEGMRLRHQVLTDNIAYAHWSPVGNAVGVLFFEDLSVAQLENIYPALWFFHFIMWISIMAILPWTKLKHILTSSLNIMFHDPERQARAALSTPFNLQEMMDSGDMDVPEPVRTIRDFTWKDRLAFDACTNCGRCEAMCPADAAGRPLSPRKLIQDLKTAMWEDYREGKKNPDHKPKSLTEAVGAESVIEEATLWSCTTCRACMTECPVDIEHVDIITEMRRGLVMDSKVDEHQQKLLVNLTNAGNPYGFPMSDRDAWRSGLPPGVVVPTAAEKVAEGKGVELLWWVGCAGSFDPRNNEVTRSVATLLNAADVDFCILGNDEKCTGDPARRLGEEGRFQQSVLENLAVLQGFGVKKILTQCPHCFNSLRNEYPEFGGDFEVVHHTEYLEELIKAQKLPLRGEGAVEVTYHDSCYLGRHNGIFDAPRTVLESAGFPVLEMAQSGERGLCCGAGGSNMWYEVEQEDRINIIRAKQAADTGAGTVVSACPFCLTMVNDGIGLTGNEGKMVAKDLSELLVERLDWTPPAVEETATASEGGDFGGWSG